MLDTSSIFFIMLDSSTIWLGAQLTLDFKKASNQIARWP